MTFETCESLFNPNVFINAFGFFTPNTYAMLAYHPDPNPTYAYIRLIWTNINNLELKPKPILYLSGSRTKRFTMDEKFDLSNNTLNYYGAIVTFTTDIWCHSSDVKQKYTVLDCFTANEQQELTPVFNRRLPQKKPDVKCYISDKHFNTTGFLFAKGKKNVYCYANSVKSVDENRVDLQMGNSFYFKDKKHSSVTCFHDINGHCAGVLDQQRSIIVLFHQNHTVTVKQFNYDMTSVIKFRQMHISDFIDCKIMLNQTFEEDYDDFYSNLDLNLLLISILIGIIAFLLLIIIILICLFKVKQKSNKKKIQQLLLLKEKQFWNNNNDRFNTGRSSDILNSKTNPFVTPSTGTPPVTAPVTPIANIIGDNKKTNRYISKIKSMYNNENLNTLNMEFFHNKSTEPNVRNDSSYSYSSGSRRRKKKKVKKKIKPHPSSLGTRTKDVPSKHHHRSSLIPVSGYDSRHYYDHNHHHQQPQQQHHHHNSNINKRNLDHKLNLDNQEQQNNIINANLIKPFDSFTTTNISNIEYKW